MSQKTSLEADEKKSDDTTFEPNVRYREAFTRLCRHSIADLALDEGLRVDGRGEGDIRELSCEVDLHAPLHGSALFQRGQTQVSIEFPYHFLLFIKQVKPSSFTRERPPGWCKKDPLKIFRNLSI